MNARTLNDQSRRKVSSTEAPLTLAAAAALATSIHGSLNLGEILRACLHALQGHLPLERLSLVHHRTNDSTATLYALDQGEGAPLVGPRVIVLENSRLRQCIVDHEPRVIEFGTGVAQDAIEQRHLLQQDTGTVIYSPLVLKDKFKGVLILALQRGSRLTAVHMSLLSYTTAHLALAVENSDMHYLECRRGRQLSMVSEIAKQAVMVEDLADFLASASTLIRLSFDYVRVQIWTAGPAPDGLTIAAQACRLGAAAESNLPAMVEECARQNSILCNNNLPVSAGPEAGSELAVPIRLRGKLLGILFLESNRLDAFPSEDLDTMEAIASLMASAYDNLRALEHAQESNEYMQAILESAKHLAVLSTDTLGFVMTSSIGSETIFRLSQKQIVGEDILTLFTDSRFRRELSAYIANPTISTLERIKLAQQGAEVVSYLDVSLQRVYDPAKRPVGFLCIVQDVTENVLLERMLESLSITDELTGLYNRRQFFAAITAEMERCHRFQRSISLCFFDLDRFKQFNDTHGHLRGDQALKETAELILSLVRSKVDTCYRYGGDEFTIIMPETTLDNARVVAERIRESVGRHFQHEITVSIGITSSADAAEAEDLVERADRAMYGAKSLGGNCTIINDE
ncbi:MAG: diguanylate cyclase [Acidobacteriia bacterium]|nr:diguanylate cyclase [Terriglobia bacterium]